LPGNLNMATPAPSDAPCRPAYQIKHSIALGSCAARAVAQADNSRRPDIFRAFKYWSNNCLLDDPRADPTLSVKLQGGVRNGVKKQ
jgi:hypothetical protein